MAISDGALNAILARLRHWFEAELPAAASPSPPGATAPAAGDDADLNEVTALLETLAAEHIAVSGVSLAERWAHLTVLNRHHPLLKIA